MKPMIALIATGIVLLLIMLYFGKTSFEGTFETNVYQNSVKYDKTAPIIKELEMLITNVVFENMEGTKTKINFNSNIQSKYDNAIITGIEITYPNKNSNMFAIRNNLSDNFYYINQQLPAGLYTVIFHIKLNDHNNIKVLKSVFSE